MPFSVADSLTCGLIAGVQFRPRRSEPHEPHDADDMRTACTARARLAPGNRVGGRPNRSFDGRRSRSQTRLTRYLLRRCARRAPGRLRAVVTFACTTRLRRFSAQAAHPWRADTRGTAHGGEAVICATRGRRSPQTTSAAVARSVALVVAAKDRDVRASARLGRRGEARLAANGRQARTDGTHARSRVRGETCAEHAAQHRQKTRRKPRWQISVYSSRWCNPRLEMPLTV